MNMASLETAAPARSPLRAARASNCADCSARILSFCNAVDEDRVDRLAAITTSHKVEAHREFVIEGDPAEYLFNVTSGLVKVFKMLPDGRQQITGFLFPGDFVGLASNDRYTYGAAAVTPVTYCRFRRRHLDALLAEFPAVERRLLGIASSELAAAQDQMLLLGRKTALEKVASFILMLARRGPAGATAGGPACGSVRLAMTRADIGDYLGLTIETVSRVMTQLRKSGAIALPTPDEVRIVAPDRLESLADGA